MSAPSAAADVRAMAREFLAKELAPVVAEHDEKEEFPLGVYRKMLALGLPTVAFPREFGGLGDLRALDALAEAMAAVDPGFALSVLASSLLFGQNVARLGTPEQKRRYLGGLGEGKIGCWALTEPDAGSDATGILTRAERQGGDYVLTGTKTFITNAPIADYFIVLAREGGTGIDGGTAFLLERGDRGLELSQPLKKLGHRTSPTGQIFLEACRVPAERILGAGGKAFYEMKHSLDVERLLFSGFAQGIMGECLRRSVAYARERKQFGRALAEFQLVQEHLAEMTGRIELLSAYGDRLFQRYEAGLPIHKEVAVLKFMGAGFCQEVADRAVQIFGGNGYMREYGVEKLLRDARLFPIGGGTSEINKLIVAKETLRHF